MEEVNIPVEEQEEKIVRKRKTSWKGTLAEDRRFVEHVLQDAEALTKATLAGYTRSDLEKGLGMADAIAQADHDYVAKDAARAQQYELFRQGMENLRKTYLQHLGIARRLIDGSKEMEISKKLLLKGTRPRSIDAILDYVNRFYSFALEDKDIGLLFKAYNITPEIIEQMLRLTEEVSTLRELAQRKAIATTRAVKRRYEAQEAFHEWFIRFRAIYKITPEPQTVVVKTAPKK